MADKKQYLFLFTIGPVQSFIAQARKTEDLHQGSKILSDLAKAGLKVKNQQPIFPKDTNASSIPNRFLCSIEQEDPIQHGKDVELAVRNYWKDEICKKLKPYLHIKGIEEQMNAHLEIHWAFVSVEKDDSDYREQYEKLERLLGAVKNARSFSQFNYQGTFGEKGRKCSVDGERNIKFYRLTEQEQNEQANFIKNKNADSVFENKLFVKRSDDEVKIIQYQYDIKPFTFLKLQPGEGLSAICMIKRLLGTGFRSTADIAMLHVINYWFKNYLMEVCHYRNHFAGDGDTEFTAQLYFEENITIDYLKKQGYPSLANTKTVKDLQEELKQLKRLAEEDKDNKVENKYKFCRYYAIIDFDGDHMGKWLSGSKIKDPDKNLKDFHSKLSEQLACFAKEAKKIVDKYGQTVYAGGDDFLGFLNLNYLFHAMTALRNKFKELVNDKLQKLGYLNGELSFSAGVCIAHYKEPLSMVLSKANLAQKAAKSDKKGDRDAFCIVASKHSGENHETYFRWGADCENVNHLEYIVNQLITENSYSNTFIKNLTLEFSRLTDNQGKLANDTLLKAETDRLVKRSNMFKFKRDYKTDKTETKEIFNARKQKGNEDLKNSVMALFIDCHFDNFINALHICDFIHRLLAMGRDLGTLPQSEKELCNQI